MRGEWSPGRVKGGEIYVKLGKVSASKRGFHIGRGFGVNKKVVNRLKKRGFFIKQRTPLDQAKFSPGNREEVSMKEKKKVA